MAWYRLYHIYPCEPKELNIHPLQAGPLLLGLKLSC